MSRRNSATEKARRRRQRSATGHQSASLPGAGAGGRYFEDAITAARALDENTTQALDLGHRPGIVNHLLELDPRAAGPLLESLTHLTAADTADLRLEEVIEFLARRRAEEVMARRRAGL